MTLKEKFIKLYPHQTEEYLDHEEAEKCELIAEEFAIGFAEWVLDIYIEHKQNYILEELLEIYKKEKGL